MSSRSCPRMCLLLILAGLFGPHEPVWSQTNGYTQRKPIEGLNFLGGGGKVSDQAPNKKQKPQVTGKTGGNQYMHTGMYAAEAKGLLDEADKAAGHGDLDTACKALQKSLAVRIKVFGASDKKIPEIRQHLADLLARQSKTQEAIKELKYAIASYVQFFGPGCTEAIPALTALGGLYSKNNNFSEAYNLYHQAYLLEKRAKGPKSKESMSLRLQLAHAAKCDNNLETAADLYREAVYLQSEDTNLISETELKKTFTDYADTLQMLKRDDEAQKILLKLNESEQAKVPAGQAERHAESNQAPSEKAKN